MKSGDKSLFEGRRQKWKQKLLNSEKLPKKPEVTVCIFVPDQLPACQSNIQ